MSRDKVRRSGLVAPKGLKSSSSEARVFQNVEHGFEDLEKQEMHNKRRKHNRDNAKQYWKTIIRYMSYGSRVKLVNPEGTSSTCPLCEGRLVKL